MPWASANPCWGVKNNAITAYFTAPETSILAKHCRIIIFLLHNVLFSLQFS